MGRQVKFGNIREDMKHIYYDNKRELDKVENTLMNRNRLSERALKELNWMRDQLILRMNDCIED